MITDKGNDKINQLFLLNEQNIIYLLRSQQNQSNFEIKLGVEFLNF